jgi:hypothetical protein
VNKREPRGTRDRKRIAVSHQRTVAIPAGKLRRLRAENGRLRKALDAREDQMVVLFRQHDKFTKVLQNVSRLLIWAIENAERPEQQRYRPHEFDQMKAVVSAFAKGEK